MAKHREAKDFLKKVDGKTFVASSGNIAMVSWFDVNALRINWWVGNGTKEDHAEFEEWLAKQVEPHEFNVTTCDDPEKEDEMFVKWVLGK